jgi:tungstate transport system ATP-binding protein
MFSRSVRENVGYGLTIRGVDKERRKPLVDSALELVGLSHLAEAYAPRLSGGETQRVAIARALASRPKVLLLDEPTASVDTQNRVIIEQIVADLRDRGETTIVLCTHNRSQAAALCPKVIYLEDGRLAERLLRNAYAGQIVLEDGQMWCRIADRFRVPVQNCEPGRGRLVVEPDVVRLRAVTEPGLNRGTLTRVRLEGGNVSLSIDLGRPLYALMPLGDFQNAGLEVGALVEADIPVEAVQCFMGS